MKRLGFCLAVVSLGATILSAQAPGSRAVRASGPARPLTFQAPPTFQKYCFECHGGEKHRGDVSLERLIQQSAQTTIGDHWDEWDKVAEMLES